MRRESSGKPLARRREALSASHSLDHHGHPPLRSLVLLRKGKTVPSLRTAAHSRRYAPPLPSRAPGPPRQTLSPSLSGAPFRSLRFVGHATHPLSLPPGFPSHPLNYGTLVRRGLKGRYSNLIRGPLFRKRRRSFAREPPNPLGSVRLDPPPCRCPLSYLPLAPPVRFAPFRLPQGRLPSRKVSRRAFVATSAPQLVLDLLPTLAWKTLFGCLRETSCSRSSSRTPWTSSRTDPAHCVGLI